MISRLLVRGLLVVAATPAAAQFVPTPGVVQTSGSVAYTHSPSLLLQHPRIPGSLPGTRKRPVWESHIIDGMEFTLPANMRADDRERFLRATAGDAARELQITSSAKSITEAGGNLIGKNRAVFPK
jgi:hypothetical protein